MYATVIIIEARTPYKYAPAGGQGCRPHTMTLRSILVFMALLASSGLAAPSCTLASDLRMTVVDWGVVERRSDTDDDPPTEQRRQLA